ncbi:hypothetical protein GWK47_009142 [Chionoecetes opilio]|uniref:Uncharacterized protein n=1 Tax=Chionoecetes opilio TaxID=41210 RepID=A0A8J4Y3N5_CHIOP|nr:hypothetical protein GWK47_009142 [Chionoecetes opilio]
MANTTSAISQGSPAPASLNGTALKEGLTSPRCLHGTGDGGLGEAPSMLSRNGQGEPSTPPTRAFTARVKEGLTRPRVVLHGNGSWRRWGMRLDQYQGGVSLRRMSQRVAAIPLFVIDRTASTTYMPASPSTRHR